MKSLKSRLRKPEASPAGSGLGGVSREGRAGVVLGARRRSRYGSAAGGPWTGGGLSRGCQEAVRPLTPLRRSPGLPPSSGGQESRAGLARRGPGGSCGSSKTAGIAATGEARKRGSPGSGEASSARPSGGSPETGKRGRREPGGRGRRLLSPDFPTSRSPLRLQPFEEGRPGKRFAQRQRSCLSEGITPVKGQPSGSSSSARRGEAGKDEAGWLLLPRSASSSRRGAFAAA